MVSFLMLISNMPLDSATFPLFFIFARHHHFLGLRTVFSIFSFHGSRRPTVHVCTFAGDFFVNPATSLIGWQKAEVTDGQVIRAGVSGT